RALFVIFLIAAAAQADVIDDVINAYGGAEAWSKVKSFRQSGTVASPMRPAPGDVTRTWTRPDKLTFEVVYPTSKETRVVDGDHGTQNGKEATGMGLAAMRLQAARLAIPALLLDRRANVKVNGNTLEVAIAPGLTVAMEVDPKTHRVMRSTGKGEGIEFATSYSDFRSVGGLLFPFSEENFANGTKTATTTLTKIEINP
ncbi:MAG TPA: hypothetical protein VG323_17125, partial [Thermoanaerobaculia bacterium]|nr:hypothetical protein [Thermoanaerobaculia bacterium]